MGKGHLFEDGEKVRLKETGEVVTIDHWWYMLGEFKNGIAQYNIVEHPGTWYAEYELEKSDESIDLLPSIEDTDDKLKEENEGLKKAMKQIIEAYEYGQPDHNGEVMAEVEDTCNAMFNIASSALNKL